jgi:hypothetical protein
VINPFGSGGAPPEATPGLVNPFASPEEDGGSPTPWGFVGNVIEEAGDMVEGVTHLLGAGAHDIAQGVKDILPGEQYGESEGYKIDDIAAALPAALSQDYGERYGINKFQEGDIWGGISDILTGLYERPLSAIGDALLVGKAVSLPAKAGLLGSEAGSAGARILGHTPVEGAGLLSRTPTAAKGVMEGVSLTAAKQGGGTFGLALSENPVARLAQTKAYKLAQYGGRMDRFGNAAGYAMRAPNLGQQNTAKLGIAIADELNLPIWRPTVSKAVEGRGVSKALSIMGITSKDEWVPAAQAIDRIIRDLHDSVDRPYFRDGVQDDLMGYVQGTDGVIDAPSNRPVVGWDPDPELSASVADAPVSPASALQGSEDVVGRLARAFGGTYRNERGAATRTGWRRLGGPDSARYAPHDMTGDPNRLRFQAITDDMDEAGNTVRGYADALEGEVAWIRNDVATPGSYDGYHAGIRTMNSNGDEVMVEVSVATPEMAQSQRMWGEIATKADALEAEYNAILKSLEVDPTDPRASALPKLSDEIEAYRFMNDNAFDFSRRVKNGGGAYDPVLMAADRIRPLVFNHATLTELKSGVLTARKAVDRAFGPIRAMKYRAMLRDTEAELQALIEDGIERGAKATDLIPETTRILEARFGAGHPVIERTFRTDVDWDIPFETEEGLSGVLSTGEKTIAGDQSWLRRGWREDPAAAARRIVDRVDEITHKSIVENADEVGWTWKDLVGESEGMGIRPQYYPHIKASKMTQAAEAMGLNRGSRVIEGVTPREKKWGGWLYESGRYEKDPVKAYQSLFREVARHHEFADAMEDLAEKYGRQVTEAELQMAATGGLKGQVIISRKGLTKFVSQRARLMELTHDGMMQGDDLPSATVHALEELLDQAVQDFKAGEVMEDVWVLPQHVAKHIDRMAKLTLGPKFNFYYDSAMNMWKASVLSMSPRWVVNNTLGNLAYMSVAVPQAIKYFIAQLMPSRRAMMRALLGDEFSGQLERDFIHGTLGDPSDKMIARAGDAEVGWAERYGSWEQDTIGSRIPSPEGGVTGTRYVPGGNVPAHPSLARAGFGALAGGRKVSSGIRRLNSWIEDAARRGVAIESLRKQAMLGWESRFQGTMKTLERISAAGIPDRNMWGRTVNDVNAVLGDYLVMSPMEQQIIRRYAMPFYAFYRHTAKFVARMPFEHPLKAKVLEQITEIDRHFEGSRPDYLRGAQQIMPGMWLNLGRGNPMNAVTDAYAPQLTHPLLSLAIGRLTGTNPFGEPYYPGPEDGVFETSGGAQYAVKYGPNGEYLGVQPLSGAWQPPMAQSILSMVPQFALLPGVDVFGRDFARKAAGLAGVSYSSFDIDRYREYQMREELEAYSRGAGLAARTA